MQPPFFTPMQLLKSRLICAFLLAGFLTGCRTETVTVRTDAPNAYTRETPAEHDARMKWFREARFGMFIHWGLYSQAAGEWNGQATSGAGEWIMNDLKIHPLLDADAKLRPARNPLQDFDSHAAISPVTLRPLQTERSAVGVNRT